MERAEEYSFRNDVYTTLIRFSNYKASGFLAGERKSCPSDSVFFSMLLTSSDELLGKAYRKGKMIALYTEPFLNAYKKVVNDELAYYVYLHQDELSTLTDPLFKDMGSVDTRFTNVFNKYWRDKCSRSVRILYYRTLITDSSAPKFDGIGLESSRLMYEKILSFKASVDDYLKQHKPFRGLFGVGRQCRRMFAVQMVHASLSGEESLGASAMMAASVELAIITMILMMIIISSTASASHSASH